MLAGSAEKNTRPTPWPWMIVPPGGPQGPFYGLINSRGNVVALQIVGEANTRLIAAAPDLLASCIELRDVLNHDCGATEEEHLYEHIGPATIRASAAITKAGAVEL